MAVDLFNLRIWRINIAYEKNHFGCRHRYYQKSKYVPWSRLYFYIGHLFVGKNMYYTKHWPFISFKWYGKTTN